MNAATLARSSHRKSAVRKALPEVISPPLESDLQPLLRCLKKGLRSAAHREFDRRLPSK
jgi:hypothetical protein